MRIGELARQAGCGVDTVRYYEREGLLAPADRGNGNYRQYGEADVERLTFIPQLPGVGDESGRRSSFCLNCGTVRAGIAARWPR